MIAQVWPKRYGKFQGAKAFLEGVLSLPECNVVAMVSTLTRPELEKCLDGFSIEIPEPTLARQILGTSYYPEIEGGHGITVYLIKRKQ